MKRRPTTSARTKRAALAISAVALLSGCGMGGGLYDTPLPGGADVGADPITITADFEDVVDLVPQSSVKVDQIDVGRVSDIELNDDGRSARVTLVIRGDLDLPAATTARLQQTSLLGEKYVALVRPDGSSATSDELDDGANIGLAGTSQVAEIEQVLGAMSMVINGGGIGKFQEISRELQQVSDGRPEEIREFLRTTDTFVTGLNSRKSAITGALDGLAALSTTLEGDTDKIETALEGLSPGMQVLVDQRDQLVDMLGALERLSRVSVRTLNASQKDMVEDLKLLEPILANLAEAGDALPNSLELLLTYPFPDAVLDTIRGDYLNVFVTTNYTSLPPDCVRMGCPWPQYPDTGARPPISLLDLGEQSGDPGEEPETDPSQSPDPSASAEPSESPSPSDSPSAPESESPSSTPSPSLLPPTDSAMPGYPSTTVEVPSQGSGSSSADSTPGEGN